MPKYEEQFLTLIGSNLEMMNDLKMIRALKLPHAYIAAGYIRNYIWDQLHGYESRTPLHDIDVIYYDLDVCDEKVEREYEQLMEEQTGSSLWSFKNQARMHIQNEDEPYTGIEDAISHWPETVTAIAVRLEDDDRLSYICPYGLEPIFEYRVSQSPLFKDRNYYESRVAKKNWQKIWPRLMIT